MEKKLKDYLHFYLGCEGIAETLAPFKTKLVAYNSTNDLRNGISLSEADQYKFKPILRALSDMSISEADELKKRLPASLDNLLPNIKASKNTQLWINSVVPNAFVFLLSKHFDLFGLIKDGLALDTTTLNPTVAIKDK